MALGRRELGRREVVRRTLRARRAAVDLSQLAVAERLGIPEKRYWRIENGYDLPNDRECVDLAKLLKVDVSELPWQAVEAKAS